VLAGAVTAGANNIRYNPASYEITYVDDQGTTQIVDLHQIIKANETVTTLTNNGDGTLTYRSEDGTVVTFDVNMFTVTDNGGGTYTITHADGTNVIINVSGDVLKQLQDNTSNIHNEIVNMVEANQTITRLGINVGSLEYTNED